MEFRKYVSVNTGVLTIPLHFAADRDVPYDFCGARIRCLRHGEEVIGANNGDGRPCYFPDIDNR